MKNKKNFVAVLILDALAVLGLILEHSGYSWGAILRLCAILCCIYVATFNNSSDIERI